MIIICCLKVVVRDDIYTIKTVIIKTNRKNRQTDRQLSIVGLAAKKNFDKKMIRLNGQKAAGVLNATTESKDKIRALWKQKKLNDKKTQTPAFSFNAVQISIFTSTRLSFVCSIVFFSFDLVCR